MRRTDRLYALVEELRARAPRPVTRNVLADRFEVSARTIERDVLALQTSGVPIWTERGRRGGYAIDSRWTLPPLNFDATEALAVIAALTAARSMPFADAGRRAEQKILAAMRADDAARVRALAAKLRVADVAPSATRRVLSAVEQAVVERRVVAIEYADRDGGVSARPVEAHGLHLAPRASYLLGWCRLRDDARVFRLDRIVSVNLTDEVAPAREIDSLLDWADVVAPEAANLKEDALKKPGRRGGPPRRADDTTGSSSAYARAVALELPRVAEAEYRGERSFAVGGKVFLVLRPDDVACLGTPPREREVRLRRVGRDEVRAAIEAAWSLVAPKRTASAFTPARKSGITASDVRRIAMSLPGAVEEPERGGRRAYAIAGTKKRSTFAWLGSVNNLLPPDDADALMIRVSPEERDALMAEQPGRFFTTPHYADWGGVVTRLSENGPEDLEELWEVFASAWSGLASEPLLEHLDVTKAKAKALARRVRGSKA